MNYASIWHENDISKRIAVYYLKNNLSRLKWKNGKENILEVGCAEGWITSNLLYPQIQDHVGKLLAVDKLREMIDFAKEKNKISQIDYQILDITDSRATEKYQNQFDHIFSLFVAHMIPDNRNFFAVLHDMLKTNGQIFVTIIPNNIGARNFNKQMKEEKWRNRIVQEKIFADYSDDPEKDIRNILTEMGFEIEVCEHEALTYDIRNYKDLLRTFFHMVAHEKVPAEIQEDFVQEYIQKCISDCTYLGEPDKYKVPYQQLICIATKID